MSFNHLLILLACTHARVHARADTRVHTRADTCVHARADTRVHAPLIPVFIPALMPVFIPLFINAARIFRQPAMPQLKQALPNRCDCHSATASWSVQE